jgi:protein-tyrosine phosphatase
MNHLVNQAGLTGKIVCDSAGTSSYHLGESPDRRMSAAAARRGIMLKGQARQFQVSDFEEFDLILAMDRQNYRDIVERDLQGKYQGKVRLICDYATQDQVKDVPDPYYGGQSGFDKVIDLLLDACSGLLEEVKNLG